MSEPELIDCELRLAAPDQASLHFRGGVYPGPPRLDEATMSEIRATLDLVAQGTKMFEALFPPETDLLAGYREALSHAEHAEKPLRLRLQVASAAVELHALRWELLYDPKKKIAFGRSSDIAFSRCPEVPKRGGEPVEEMPRLLVAIAEPTDLEAFELPASGREKALAAIQEALAPLSGQLSCEILPPPITAARLAQWLRSGKFHALHLQAHGLLVKERAKLLLENEDGTVARVDEGFFAEIFKGLHGLRLVTLLACHGGAAPGESPLSGLGPGLIRLGVPAVVAMRQVVRFDAARRFCQHFYRELAATGIVDQATNEARKQLFLELGVTDNETDEWSNPILFMRLADGRLWTPRPAAPKHDPLPARDKAEINWQKVLACIDADNLVPVLGPGLCRGLLPSSGELAERWAAEDEAFPLEGRTDLSTVAQFFATRMDAPVDIQDRLLGQLKEELLERQKIEERQRFRNADLSTVIDKIADRIFEHDPDEPHRALASLPLSTYVTTNPDTFMAAALRFCSKTPQIEICRWRDHPEPLPEDYARIKGSLKEPLVFHLYGNASDASSLVLTEDHHLDFLYAIAGPMNPRFPESLRGKLSKGVLLLLGYDLRLLECRVLLRGVVKHLKEHERKGRIAVLQIDPRDADPRRLDNLRAYVASCCEDLEITVVYRSVRDFLGELHKRWKSANGNRG